MSSTTRLATLLTLIAVAFGLRVPLAGALITVGIVGLLGVSLASLSYAAGLWLKSEDALARCSTWSRSPCSSCPAFSCR